MPVGRFNVQLLERSLFDTDLTFAANLLFTTGGFDVYTQKPGCFHNGNSQGHATPSAGGLKNNHGCFRFHFYISRDQKNKSNHENAKS